MRNTRGNLHVGAIVGAAALVVTLAVALALLGGRDAAAAAPAVAADDPHVQHTLADTSGQHAHDLTIIAVWAERALRDIRFGFQKLQGDRRVTEQQQLLQLGAKLVVIIYLRHIYTSFSVMLFRLPQSLQ